MKKNEVSDLRKAVNERIKFLKKVMKFAVDVVYKYGKANKCPSCNSCASYTLDDLDGFAFTFAPGRGSGEKSHLLIWYGFLSIPAVLVVEWNGNDIGSSEVALFCGHGKWQNDILDVIEKHKEKLTEKKKKPVKRVKRESLEETALRLKVI